MAVVTASDRPLATEVVGFFMPPVYSLGGLAHAFQRQGDLAWLATLVLSSTDA
jgi:hypothetical protein